uniref:Uncharacterized protein n=1 Tax=Arundo donax TaxID=35708 RepID=A0A0A9HQL4_ARUDO
MKNILPRNRQVTCRLSHRTPCHDRTPSAP